jgi:two-component system KDP operon response regulator KdpE
VQYPAVDEGEGLVGEESVLIVSKDARALKAAANPLTSHGYKVREARSVKEAVEKLEKEKYDAILLESRTPGIGGVKALRAIRSHSDSTIVAFTSRGTYRDKAAALKAGADDYLADPVKGRELLARLRAALHRGRLRANELPEHLLLPGMEIDFLSRVVRANGRESSLTPKEFDLLSYFVIYPNRVIQGAELLRAVWGPRSEHKVESLRVLIKQLRQKIEPQRSKPRYLLTQPWVGYRFCMPR